MTDIENDSLKKVPDHMVQRKSIIVSVVGCWITWEMCLMTLRVMSSIT